MPFTHTQTLGTYFNICHTICYTNTKKTRDNVCEWAANIFYNNDKFPTLSKKAYAYRLDVCVRL